MKFIFKLGKVGLEIEAEDSEASGRLSWEGDFQPVLDFLSNADGPFGHSVLDSAGQARPGDVAFALGMSDLKWDLESGKILQFTSAPKGCVS